MNTTKLQIVLEKIGDLNEQDLNRNSNFQMESLQLEPIKIPTFDGQYENWPTFSNLFETLIIKNVFLSNLERMQYLKSVLTDDAAQVIASLNISNENFEMAWKLLSERFDNKRVLIDREIDKILSLEPVDGSSRELREFYDHAKAHFIMLKDVSADQIMVHILKNKLDKQSRMLYQPKIENNEIIENTETFFMFLHKRCRVLETVYSAGSIEEEEDEEDDDDNNDSAFCHYTNAEAGEYVHD